MTAGTEEGSMRTRRAVAGTAFLVVVLHAAVAWGEVTAYAVHVPTDTLYRLELEGGTLDAVADLDPELWINSLAFDRSGSLLGFDVEGNRLLEIDVETGATTVLGSFDLGLENVTGLAVDACGRIYVTTFEQLTSQTGRSRLRTLDPAGGLAPLVGDLPKVLGTLAAQGELLYSVSPLSFYRAGQDEVVLSRIDPRTLAVADLDTGFLHFWAGGGLDFDAQGFLWSLGEVPPIGVPPPPQPARRVNVATNEVASFAGSYSLPIAIAPAGGLCGTGGGPQAIPAASTTALVILAAMLALLGALTLGRPAAS
jgi:hypothetical protein